MANTSDFESGQGNSILSRTLTLKRTKNIGTYARIEKKVRNGNKICEDNDVVLRLNKCRKSKYATGEERKAAIRNSKTKYMLNKEWYCSIWPIHNYSLAVKWKHLQKQKHKNDEQKAIDIARKISEVRDN